MTFSNRKPTVWGGGLIDLKASLCHCVRAASARREGCGFVFPLGHEWTRSSLWLCVASPGGAVLASHADAADEFILVFHSDASQPDKGGVECFSPVRTGDHITPSVRNLFETTLVTRSRSLRPPPPSQERLSLPDVCPP